MHGSWEASFTVHLAERALGRIAPRPVIYIKGNNLDDLD